MIAQRRKRHRQSVTVARLILVALFAILLLQAAPQKAHACSTTGQSINGYNYSSQLSSTAIFVCNSNSTTKTTSRLATSSQSTVSCTSTTQSVWTGPPTYQVKQIKVTTCGTTVIVKNIFPPPPVTSSATTPAASTSSTSSAADQAGFSPDSITLSTDKDSAAPGQSVAFNVGAAVHFKVGSVLGQAVTVRFTPTAVSWDFGDGPMPDQAFDSAVPTRHAFSLTGSQLVLARVKFVAAYRFAGQTSWTSETGYLAKSASVTVVIGRATSQPAMPAQPGGNPARRIRLVTSDCRANWSAPGCFGR